jgi:hypothetical protein
LVHPGVWLKNFAAAALARAQGGFALNLIIDGDRRRSTGIRVPTGTADDPGLAIVPFDAPGEDAPWEEWSIRDAGVWRSFAERVRGYTQSLLPERMLDQWWSIAIERLQESGRVGLALAQARHLAEIEWGQKNLELPQSQLCQTKAFRRFALHLLLQSPRLADAYNSVLDEYRRVHHIRNHAHPASNLVRVGPWLQAPFWVWSTANPQRRAVYVRRTPTGLAVTDLRTFERPLPISAADAEEAVAELDRWEAGGLKLRSRALVTTMFARMALADLFIHGIGGAKYDEVTDGICARFFQAPPPRFATLSGALRLPIVQAPAGDGDVRELRQQVRELEYHPEAYLAASANGPLIDAGALELIQRKRRWVRTPKTPENAALRHAAIVETNRKLQPFVAARRSELERQAAEAGSRLRASRILSSREYAFCLFPRRLLEQFLLDFSA